MDNFLQEHYFYQAEAMHYRQAYDELHSLAKNGQWDEAFILYKVWDDLSAGTLLVHYGFMSVQCELQSSYNLFKSEREEVK